MEDDRYLEALEALSEEEDDSYPPDRVQQFTTDVQGRRLPCEFVQLNQRYAHHLAKIPSWLDAQYDYFGLFFGYPGSGKSHLMIRSALYLNADFSLDDITFTPEQFDDWVTQAAPGSVGLFDEADIMAEHHANNVLRALTRNLQRIREKRLVTFFATPTMQDMSKYFAFRARMVVYCKMDDRDPLNRGYIRFWQNQDLIADLFARMKKAYSENSRVYESAFATLANSYQGRMVPDDWPIDPRAYSRKKESARREMQEQDKETPKRREMRVRREAIPRLQKLFMQLTGKELTQKEIGFVFDVSHATISTDMRAENEKV